MPLVQVSPRHSLALFSKDLQRADSVLQHEEALAYCREHRLKAARGLRKARKETPGRWPLVKTHTLKSRLAGSAKNGDENSGNKLLTNRERKELAAAMCAAGKHGRAFDKEKRNQAVVDILWHRDRTNRKGGRKFVALSPPARQVLKTGKAGRDFWRCFFVQSVRAPQARRLEPAPEAHWEPQGTTGHTRS